MQPTSEQQRCPECGQFVHLKRVSISAGMVAALAALMRAESRRPDMYHHWDNVVADLMKAGGRVPPSARGGDKAKLRFYGLVEQAGGVRKDGSRRAGYWRTTEKGRAFMRGTVRVQKYVYLFNNSLRGVAGPSVGVRECTKKAFDYAEVVKWIG